MKKMLIIVFILAFGIAGCGSEARGRSEIVSVKIQCTDMCKTMTGVSFTEKVYENEDELKVFQQAIEKAEKMTGILNYVVLFDMLVTFEDGTQQKFVLNISDEDGSTGLLIDTAHSEQGYTIPNEQAQKLRKIIYNS